MIVRRSYAELIENHIRILRTELMCGTSNAIATYNDSRKEFKLFNGSIILCRYCSSDRDLDYFQGLEIDRLFVDEATQFTEYQLKVMEACVRGTNSFPKRIYYTCNPSGQGMGYVRRLYVDRKFEQGEDPDEYTFIQSLVTDNKALMESNPDYIKQLEALPYHLREAWLNGRWDVFEGSFFGTEFRESPDLSEIEKLGVSYEDAKRRGVWTHVIEPFDVTQLDESWVFYASYDWGYGKPFSMAWSVYDSNTDTFYRILECYGMGNSPNEGIHWTNKQQFDEFQRIEQEHPWLRGRKIYRVADPSIWDGSHDTYGVSCAEEAEKHGMFFTKGNNERVAGWMQVRERLKFDERGKARLYFFKNCKAIIRTMPLMVFDKHRPEDMDSTLEDHPCDELRYLMQERPIKPRIIKAEALPISDPLNQFRNPSTGLRRY